VRRRALRGKTSLVHVRRGALFALCVVTFVSACGGDSSETQAIPAEPTASTATIGDTPDESQWVDGTRVWLDQTLALHRSLVRQIDTEAKVQALALRTDAEAFQRVRRTLVKLQHLGDGLDHVQGTPTSDLGLRTQNLLFAAVSDCSDAGGRMSLALVHWASENYARATWNRALEELGSCADTLATVRRNLAALSESV
jgi:hypothetical protein